MAKRGRGRPPLAAEKRKVIAANLRATPNATQVAKHHGISSSTVWHIAQEAGIALTKHRTTSEIRATIAADLRVTPNATQVAKHHGVSTATVWHIAQEAGIELTRVRGPRSPTRKAPANIASQPQLAKHLR